MHWCIYIFYVGSTSCPGALSRVLKGDKGLLEIMEVLQLGEDQGPVTTRETRAGPCSQKLLGRKLIQAPWPDHS